MYVFSIFLGYSHEISLTVNFRCVGYIPVLIASKKKNFPPPFCSLQTTCTHYMYLLGSCSTNEKAVVFLIAWLLEDIAPPNNLPSGTNYHKIKHSPRSHPIVSPGKRKTPTNPCFGRLIFTDIPVPYTNPVLDRLRIFLTRDSQKRTK